MRHDRADALDRVDSLKQSGLHPLDTAWLSPIVLRAIITAMTLYLFAKFPMALLVVLWATVVWIVPRAIHDRRRRQNRESQPDPTTKALIDSLQLEVADATTKIKQLEMDLEAAKRSAKMSLSERGDISGHPVFRRVGLDRDCPKWLAEMARREYRRRLHPDTRTRAEHKVEAEQRFKEAEEIFAKIWRLRGF